MQQFTLDVAVDTGPSLDNFYTLGNETVHQHIRLWLGEKSQPRSPVPIYLWGDSGSGKTHLLKAMQRALQERGESFGWIDSSVSKPLSFNPAWRFVLLDDVDRYTATQQHVAFNWFVNSQTSGCAVMAVGKAAPAQLILRDDLRSRLGWGDIFALHTLPDFAQREVLRLSAHARGVQLSDEVLDYMSSRFTRDLANLMQWLDKLDQYALQTKRAITVPLLKDMLDNFDQLL